MTPEEIYVALWDIESNLLDLVIETRETHTEDWVGDGYPIVTANAIDRARAKISEAIEMMADHVKSISDSIERGKAVA